VFTFVKGVRGWFFRRALVRGKTESGGIRDRVTLADSP
jgi:hypothetical protein